MKNQTDTEQTRKPGVWKRFIDSLDKKMKEKADEKSAQGSCCAPGGKGGGKKCC